MPLAIHLPRVDDLYAAPELAVLALLEASVHVAILALGAAHPEMQDLDDYDKEPHELRAAVAILDAARILGENINRYRLAIVLASRRDELLPF